VRQYIQNPKESAIKALVPKTNVLGTRLVSFIRRNIGGREKEESS